MASAEKFKSALLGLVVAALLAVAAEASVTVYNPAKLSASMVVDGNVRSMAGLPVVTVDVSAAGVQTIQIIAPETNKVMAVLSVSDHDAAVVLPYSFSSDRYLAWKVAAILPFSRP